MISVNDAKFIHLLSIFWTFQSFSYCKLNHSYKFIPILLILLQMLVKLFLGIE